MKRTQACVTRPSGLGKNNMSNTTGGTDEKRL